MSFDFAQWERFEFHYPIYLHKERPAWFVPNHAGDQILQNQTRDFDEIQVRRFLQRLPDGPHEPFPGRATQLKTEFLREIWFHITNRCNLACAHCLFAASPAKKAELPAERIFSLADEAYALGCRVFAFTGGEPLIHPKFSEIVDHLLAYNHSHVVVLTNGMNLNHYLEVHQWDFSRFHLQISVDGLAANHDRIRGKGMFEKLSAEIQQLKSKGIPFTISMCVDRHNLAEMPDMIDFAADSGAGNVHFMWYFIRGRGDADGFAPPDQIAEQLIQAAGRAEKRGIEIDNIESLKTQVFAPSGTIHDGTTAGWESVAIGPDGKLYPSAALIGLDELATDLSPGLATAWRSSPVLERIRQSTVKDDPSSWRFILGGGDIDHSYMYAGTFTGKDPYLPLYEKLAQWLIAKEVSETNSNGVPQLRLKMGDILQSCGAHGSVALLHSNCLLALAHPDSLSVVKEFYTEAAKQNRTDIVNPVGYPEDQIEHIPADFRFRGYGCGSPVQDANIREGETIVDLGSGSGIECFIAARQVGKTGQVIGIDMLDPMLERAREGAVAVAQNLGFKNLDFRKGYLEKLPLTENSADCVLSNCVLNLSVHKRQAFSEIYRVLRPGGRLVISDVIAETEPDPAIKNDESLRGECIAGALIRKDLVGILEESGFQFIRFIKRFPYRTVKGHPFFSLTFEAYKPAVSEMIPVIYRGSFASVITPNGTLLTPGQLEQIPRHEAERLGDQVFILAENGNVVNIERENSCACFVASEEKARPGSVQLNVTDKHQIDCMVCGAPLVYQTGVKELHCSYCHKLLPANAVCENNHFVCDHCHTEDGRQVIAHFCLTTTETDMLALFAEIRRHPAIPVNGPEHHALVPGIILATYKNQGGAVTNDMIKTGLTRGGNVAGGYCAFMGVCGAAVGAGVALSLILDANPLKPELRQIVQTVTQQVLAEIGGLKAARCCQRDSWIALKKVAKLSTSILPIPLKAEYALICHQQSLNKECIGADCPVLIN